MKPKASLQLMFQDLGEKQVIHNSIGKVKLVNPSHIRVISERIYPFIYQFNLFILHSFFIHPFIYSSIYPFIHLFNHSFINLFRRVGTDWSRCRSWSSQYAVHCTTVSSPTLGSRVWCASPASPPTPFFKCIYFKLVVSLVLAFLSISFNPA